MAESESGARAFRDGAIDAWRLPAWLLGLSMMGVGPLARDVGYPLIGAVLSTVLVWAGPAQVVFFGMIGAGASLPATAIAVTLSAVRLLPMTAALMPQLRAGNPSRATLLLASHFIAVTVWVESMRRLPNLPAEKRRPYFFGLAFACCATASLTTALGYLLAGEAPKAIGAGLLFMTPVFFTLSLIAGARLRADWIAIGCGFALTAALGLFLGSAAALFLTGVIGGTIAFLWERREYARKAAA
ncbi:AzlC family ABC transporter permease [Terrarubrum flagellatum]|uniref:AzlC family ABC transporter permease n=1 Tax=Terrirubrum flagellatum TaxID=2895980 RepID=UPI003144FE06